MNPNNIEDNLSEDQNLKPINNSIKNKNDNMIKLLSNDKDQNSEDVKKTLIDNGYVYCEQHKGYFLNSHLFPYTTCFKCGILRCYDCYDHGICICNNNQSND